MNTILRNAAIRILVPPFAGLLVYGTWAFSVNYEYGFDIASRAAMTQGGYSFAVTLILALVIEWLFKVLRSFPFCACWVIAIACLLLYSSSWGVNKLAGTPDIWMTILPGAIMSTIYTVIYVNAIVRAQHSPE